MIKRIVKMTFQQEKLDDFLELFEASKVKIKAFEGVQSLELLQDTRQPNVLFTISFWESEEALEKYRHSELFNAIWEKTKPLFATRPRAWSTIKIG